MYVAIEILPKQKLYGDTKYITILQHFNNSSRGVGKATASVPFDNKVGSSNPATTFDKKHAEISKTVFKKLTMTKWRQELILRS
jgi:hypothetical protein